MKLPFIESGCASHLKLYVPATNVSVHVTPDEGGSVIPSISVAMSTAPGPLRWKSWKTE